MNERPVRASAPGKIILSGEHAVVYGAPALVTAVRCWARTTISSGAGDTVSIHLPDLGVADTLTLDEAHQLGAAVRDRYRAFLEGRLGIEAVLEKPGQLVQVCGLALLDERSEATLRGLRIEVVSDVPVGRGMGSSAAVIVATLQALAAWHEDPLPRARLQALAHGVEKYQHGRPSGADVHACTQGGAFLYRRGAEVQRLSLEWGPMYLVDTGKPESHTGECVDAVRRRFEGDAIWKEFEDVTLALRSAGAEDRETMAALIRTNHDLLVRIGVVPERVAGFIDALHRQGCAAKVCGAGAVRGDCAGMVLVYGEPSPKSLCAEMGYALAPLEPDEDGVTIDS